MLRMRSFTYHFPYYATVLAAIVPGRPYFARPEKPQEGCLIPVCRSRGASCYCGFADAKKASGRSKRAYTNAAPGCITGL